MNELELTIFIKFKDHSPMEFIDLLSGAFNDDVLEELQDRMKDIEYTIRRMKKMNLFEENVKEIYGDISRFEDMEEVEVLSGFNVSFE